MKVISCINFKGGSGKTTTASNLAYCLAKRGKRVLTLDYDAQSSLSTTSNIFYENDDHNIVSLLVNALFDRPITAENVRGCIVKTGFGYDLIGNTITLADLEFNLTYKYKESDATIHILKDILQKVDADYDYCLIDCAPSLGMMSLTALSASDYVLIPSDLDLLSLHGVMRLVNRINQVNDVTGSHTKVLGILKTKYRKTRKADYFVADAMDTTFKAQNTYVFKTAIPESVVAKNSLIQDKLASQTKNVIGNAYHELADEILTILHDKED